MPALFLPRLTLAAYTLLVLYLSLRPSTGSGSIEPWDKALHFGMYFIFAFLAYRCVEFRRQFYMLCAAIVVYGVAMEIAQSFTPDRSMSSMDALANTFGVMTVAYFVQRFKWLKDDGIRAS